MTDICKWRRLPSLAWSTRIVSPSPRRSPTRPAWPGLTVSEARAVWGSAEDSEPASPPPSRERARHDLIAMQHPRLLCRRPVNRRGDFARTAAFVVGWSIGRARRRRLG
eukprot:6182626-Pleurochrysis_carterae.AAC.2